MADYRSLIVADVQRSVTAVNNIIASLERDAPLTSDIIQMNYPPTTVDDFLRNSQAVEDVSPLPLRPIPPETNQARLPEYSFGIRAYVELAGGHGRPPLTEPR